MFRPLPLLFLLTLPASLTAQEKTSWQDHVRPIFENRCTNCHNPDKKKGDLDLSTYAGVMAGGSGGASVEAGDSANSTLWKVISHLAEPPMPPKGDKIPQAETDLIAKWITGGLLDSLTSSAKVKKKAAFAMSASATAGRPEGPPPMPEHLLLDPIVTPARPNAVTALAHSPWAPLAALAAPRQVLLYHSTTGELLGVLPFPDGGTPETLAFSRNGALLLAGGGIPGKQGTVIVWDIKTGLPVINLAQKDDFDTVLAADISADLSKVAMGGPGRRIRIYDTRSSQLLANIKKHTDWVTALAFSPDGVLLASGDRNGGLYVWETETGSEFQNLRNHEKMIACLAWRGDSNLLAAGSEDGTFTWWEMANGTQVKKVGSHGGVLTLGFAPDGRLISGGRDGHARIWDGNGNQQRDWVPSGGSPVLKALFSDDGKRVLTGTWSGEVKSWDAALPDAPPALLVSNPPSIDARLTALEQATAAQRAAASQAAAALSETEKAAAAGNTALTNLRATLAALPERQQTLTTQLGKFQSSLAKLESSKTNYTQALEAATREMPAPPATPASPPDTSGMPEAVKAALTEAATAEAAVSNLSRTALKVKTNTLRTAITTCEASLAQHRSAAAAATAALEKIKAEATTLPAQITEQEKAVATTAAQVKTATAALATAQAQIAGHTRDTARWQAARLQKAAAALRTEARLLKEKCDDLIEEQKSLESTVATAPAPAQTQRLAEIKEQLTHLPAEAESRQKAAEAAWQQYLDQLPK
jgi:hypothetical protein